MAAEIEPEESERTTYSRSCPHVIPEFEGNAEAESGENTLDTETYEIISVGEFKVTYYCIEEYPHICNAGPPFITATGNKPQPHRTISVDPKLIPLGTVVIIDGVEYIAEDTGGAIKGNRIDMCVAGHQEALNLGVTYVEVFIRSEIDDGESTEINE